MDGVASRILRSVENRDNRINTVVSDLKSRHEKIKSTRSNLTDSINRKTQSLSYQSSERMDKALANAVALQRTLIAKTAAHNSSVEEKSLKAREVEANRLSSLAERTLSKMEKAVSNHSSAINEVIEKCQSHNSVVSVKLDLVTQLKVQRLQEIKDEASARLSRAIDSHELLMLTTSLRCQSHNEEVGLRFESLQAKREAKLKVLQSSITVKVLQAELNHACLISEVVQSCGVHSRTVMERGGEAIRSKCEKTLCMMKDQYEREKSATSSRDDHLLQIQAGCGGKARMAIQRGEEATRAKGSKVCQMIVDAATKDSAAAVFRIGKLASIVSESNLHCRIAMAKGLEASAIKEEAIRDSGLANLERERAAAEKRELLIKAKVDKVRSPTKGRVQANVSPPTSPAACGKEDSSESFDVDPPPSNKMLDAAARREAFLLIRSEQCGQAVSRAKAVAKNVRASPAKVPSSAEGASPEGKRLHFEDELLPTPADGGMMPVEGGNAFDAVYARNFEDELLPQPADGSSMPVPPQEGGGAFDAMPPIPPPTVPVSRTSSNESGSWVVCSARASPINSE